MKQMKVLRCLQCSRPTEGPIGLEHQYRGLRRDGSKAEKKKEEEEKKLLPYILNILRGVL